MSDLLHIALWNIDLQGNEERTVSCWEWLDRQERDRAARFRFEDDRRRFLLRHAAYRQILGRAVNRSGRELQFASGHHGKPFLAGVVSSPRLEFSTSHSGDRALLAVATGGVIGVDIERLRPEIIDAALLEQTLTPEEMAAYENLQAEARTRDFFRVWTRKESVLKAAGVGLSVRPRDFSVAIAQGVLGLWSVFDLDVGPAYAATVAADRPDCVIEEHVWDWH